MRSVENKNISAPFSIFFLALSMQKLTKEIEVEAADTAFAGRVLGHKDFSQGRPWQLVAVNHFYCT